MGLDITAMRERVDELLAEHRHADMTVNEEKEALQEAVSYVEDAEAASLLIQQLAQAVQEKAHNRIAGVVSKCLSSVFDEPYAFDIRFERKRGRTEAELLFTRGKSEIDPMTASGGGVVDVAAFALRVACLLLSRPKLRRVLIMDEPFRFVSKHYQDRVRSMVEDLSEELGIQFILVTHNSALECGKVIEL